VVTDLVQIQRLGEKKRAENENLRRHMKRHDFVERKFRHMAEDIQEQIDCTKCGNCCKVATTPLQQRDVDKLAKFLRIPAQRFLNEYCMESEDEGVILKRTDETGCIFLDGTLCSVYEARPSTCEDFPHLVRGSGSLQSRMWQMIDRACYCPIVYNTLEAFKEDLGIKR
jgi:Fe-S-cluster containining protein